MTIRNTWLSGAAALLVAAPTGALAQDSLAPCPAAQQDVAFFAQPASETRSTQAEPRQDRPDGIVGEDRALPQSPDAPVADSKKEHDAKHAHGRKLPANFERLGLTDEEKTAMFRVIEQYDDQVKMVLDKFHGLHAQAIGVEAISLAQKMREQGDTQLADSPQGEQRTAGFRPGDLPDATQGDKSAEKIKELSAGSPAAGPSAEMWKQLHELHLQAVKVEAQKLAALEKLLPKEKLHQLHEFQATSGPNRPAAGEPDRFKRPDLQNDNQNPEEERRDREADREAGRGGAEAREQIDPNRSNEPLPERRESSED